MPDVADYMTGQAEFEQQYLSLRKKEGRIYTDDQARLLPLVTNDHPLTKEWKQRKFSADKLLANLKQQKRPLQILEVGCGNGWFSHQLSLIPGSEVTGIDVNTIELQQARRVFEKPQLHFLEGDIRNIEFNSGFDVILFAASLQYFSSLRGILHAALSLLKDGGEIHVLDTHFYRKDELAGAAQRSVKYFNEIGFPVMERYYFHHSLEGLEEFSYELLYDPKSFKSRIVKRSPFPWIRIKKC